MLSLAESLAGLGLLFIGLRLMSSQLQQATGGRVRHLLKAATRTSLAGLAVGTLAGAITQSSNAVAVITANLVRARLLTTKDAIPIVAGGNIGTSVLVLLAAVNFHLAVLFLIGLVGLGFQLGLDRRTALRSGMSILLGLTLLFLGIDFIKSAPGSLDERMLAGLIRGMSDADLLGLGLLVALITQSSSTATIVVLAAMKAGVIGLDGCFFAVIGANFGSGLSTLIASSGLKGVGRQLCVVHIIVKALGSALLLAAFLVAPALQLDPVALLARLGGGSGSAASVSILFLLLQLLGAIPVAFLRAFVAKIAARFSPPTFEDDVSRPRYIDSGAADDPSGAIELVKAEIRAMISHLPDLLPDLDGTHAEGDVLAVRARGDQAVAATTEAFIVELVARGLSNRDLDAVLAIQSRLGILRAVQETLAEFSHLILSLEPRPRLAFNLSESLRLIVGQLAEAGEDADELAVLISLTGDRGELLDRMRRSLAGSALDAGGEVQRLLLATSHFERAVWLVRRLAISLRPDAAGPREDMAGATSDPLGDAIRQNRRELA